MPVKYPHSGSGTTIRVTVPSPTSHALQGPVIVDSITGGFNEEHTDAKFPIGTRVQTSDGRIYYYALNSGTSLRCTQFLKGGDIDITETDTNLTYTAPVGAKTITMTAVATTIVANQFSNGYLRVGTSTTVAAGAGQFRKIRSNLAAASGDTDFTIFLYDGLTVALDTTSDVFLHESPFYKVASAVSLGLTVGVNARARVNINKYFWVQTWGPAAVPIGTAFASGVDTLRLGIISTSISCAPMSSSGLTGAQFVATSLYDSTGMAAQQYELMFLTCMA